MPILQILYPRKINHW